MSRLVMTGLPVNLLTARRPYQERQNPLLARFLAVSALAHLAILALPGWLVAAPQLPSVPAMQVSLQQSALTLPHHATEAGIGTLRSSSVSVAVAAKPRQSRADPAETTSASNVPSDDAERLNHLQTLLRGALDRQFVYPPLARRHGWQGKVELSAEIDTHGRIQNMHVLRSSGYSILDEDALATLTRIGELSQARDWLSGRGNRLVLPVVYRLVEG